MNVKNLLGILHRTLGKSRTFHAIFLKIRNQVSAVISHGLNDGIAMETNGEAWLIGKIAPDARFFIDVGANKGAWTAAFMSKAGAGVCGLMYEPSAEAARHIKSFVLPQRQAIHVELVEAAMSDRQGTMTFYEEPGCGESSSLVKGFSLEHAIARPVAVTTVDDEIERQSIAQVDMLKIDAEGYDLHVLRGAKRSLARGVVDVVQFEYNAPWALANSTLHEALDIFSKNRYSVFLLRAGGLMKFDYELYGEFYHYSNFVALSPRAIVRLADELPG